MVELKPGKLLIGADWKDAASGETFPTIDPSTAQPLTTLSLAGEADVDAAVRAARAAVDGGPWSKMPPHERARVMWKLADLVLAHADELAMLETLDVGKPIGESRKIELPLIAEILQYYAGWTTKLTGDTLPSRYGFFTYTTREPVGVVAAIVPWNFPLLLASWKLGPALAAGNAVVLKPAPESSLTALRFAALALEAGLPPGVLNVVTGGAATGQLLVRHGGVDKVSFTGSTATGQAVMRECAATMKRVTLELGGKSPNIIFADTDPETATRGAMAGIFYNKGEVCAAGSRLLVEAPLYDAVVEKLKQKAEALTQGDPKDPKTRLGPQASEAQLEKVLRYCGYGVEDGARVVTGGGRNEGAGPGYFVRPTIFADVKNDMRIAREEIFGPVLSVIRFEGADEAVRIANDSAYGLAAGIYTRDVARAHSVARRLRAGTVWINAYNVYDPAAPFGGFKLSGFGRDLGAAALDAYTELKTVFVSTAG